ncbi:hypothetical protein [Pseudokineococcus sp. 1T1Z-3]|uniref:hypothetical protein n=1 Tax=Pseudokineococcus sp. 1T1Z-3 TaxID=3132745 RepID=UPI0030ACD0B2
MATLFRVDAVLTFAEPASPEEVAALAGSLEVPSPTLADGRPDPLGTEVQVDQGGRSADVVLLVEAETDRGALEVVEAAVGEALAGSAWSAQAARLDSVRATAAYDL